MALKAASTATTTIIAYSIIIEKLSKVLGILDDWGLFGLNQVL